MSADKLASFRIDSELWERFQGIAKAKNSNASALIVAYINSAVNTDNVNTPSQDVNICIDDRIYESIADGAIGAAIDKHYQQVIAYINSLDSRLSYVEASAKTDVPTTVKTDVPTSVKTYVPTTRKPGRPKKQI